jgi:hypothetical protein
MVSESRELIYRLKPYGLIGVTFPAAALCVHIAMTSQKYAVALMLFLPCAAYFIGVSYFNNVTRVDRSGIRGVNVGACDWADVMRATAIGGRLELECRSAGDVTIPPKIVSDTKFRQSLAAWLPKNHPVNRALRDGSPN